MPQCCYLAKGAKRPSHTTNTINFDRIPFDPCNSIKRFDLCPFDQKNSTYLQPPHGCVSLPPTWWYTWHLIDGEDPCYLIEEKSIRTMKSFEQMNEKVEHSAWTGKKAVNGQSWHDVSGSKIGSVRLWSNCLGLMELNLIVRSNFHI